MNRKPLFTLGLTLASGILVGITGTIGFHYLKGTSGKKAGLALKTSPEVLYWRNPMNPSIHADHPMKDNMGMDYIPVYAQSAIPKNSSPPILYWRNPMNPSIHAGHPMKDNMGMDYIPVYARTNPAENGGISVDSRLRQTLGIKVVTVVRRPFSRTIHTAATVTFDRRRLRTLSVRFQGWIRTLAVRAPGDLVRKGEALAQVYSPELASSEKEAQIALEASRSDPASPDDRALWEAARDRLRLLGVPESEIARLEKTGQPLSTLPVQSPDSGIVTDLPLRPGSAVRTGQPLMTLADLSRVWVDVALYSDQLSWVKPGDLVTLRLPNVPGRIYRGPLQFVDPELNKTSRTVRARVAILNTDGFLKPGMYLEATLHPESPRNVLVIPRQALIRTKGRTVVITETGPGYFRPARVRLGLRSDRQVEVMSGLKEGDRVVVSGQFLMDAESRFENVSDRMEGDQP
ncbi:efflux RND transporter periplasmic adaptor subunit [Leptospirillum ferriphilum]|uniref:efflux RND transporter periplasmic adaptor subunit n=1 Tax=Leptospirillum ferriphilum TaxID=178606 RepID=UPI003EE6BB46